MVVMEGGELQLVHLSYSFSSFYDSREERKVWVLLQCITFDAFNFLQFLIRQCKE